MFKKIILVLIVLVGILAAIIHMQPEDFTITRSKTIAAPASAIFVHINDLKKWEAWSPWAKLDPNMVNTYEGPQAGVGAIVHWEGNREVGAGSMEIVEAKPSEYIKFQLDFIKPFEATSTAEFKLIEVDGKTEVTWTMDGKNNFIGKAMSLVMDCDKIAGGQFEKGLNNLEQQTLKVTSKPE